MNNWWNQLGKDSHGSRPRCILMMDGEASVVAERLTNLVGLPGVKVRSSDKWMPFGKPELRADGTWNKEPAREAKLGNPNRILGSEIQTTLVNWWLEVLENANTPNWDIASSCEINGQEGYLLIEAKAHHNELKNDSCGASNPSNRKRIQECIAEASQELSQATQLEWNLSRDTYYQMCNRFAWSWKLTQLGFPVVLVYLGFTNAAEMPRPLIESDSDWSAKLQERTQNIVPKEIWGREIPLGGASLTPLIRVFDQPFTEYEDRGRHEN